MAIKKIPVRFDAPDFNFRIELDGETFGFRFVLNDRTGRYSMTIENDIGEILLAGIAVVTNWKPLARFKDTRLPKGRLFTVDVTDGNNEPTEINFGDTVLLCYDEATA